MADAAAQAAIETLDCETDAGLGQKACIGLIVLQTDQTIEYEFARLMPGDGTALYHARIPNAMQVSPETLRQMQCDLPATAALLPPSFGFDAIGYACTSGATMNGEDQVDRIIRDVHPQAKISNPITACKAALSAALSEELCLRRSRGQTSVCLLPNALPSSTSRPVQRSSA